MLHGGNRLTAWDIHKIKGNIGIKSIENLTLFKLIQVTGQQDLTWHQLLMHFIIHLLITSVSKLH